MSYDIELIDPETKQVIDIGLVHGIIGGTYALGGTSLCELNITYNYSPYFYRTINDQKGIRFIYGMTGSESIPVLSDAISKLNNDKINNYWEPTEGNARIALCGLLSFAIMRPDGIWKGD